MRRRRGRKATWFPILPTTYVGSPVGVTWWESTLSFAEDAIQGNTTIFPIPLTLDASADNDGDSDSPDQTLRDWVEGQDYLLQRVVGKVWMSGPQTGNPDNQPFREGIGCIALAILPADAESSTPDLPAEEYHPLLARNAAKPWIWRRTWRLNGQIWTDPNRGFPVTTAGYSSVADGGHVDAKTKRRVTKDHRLYLIAAAGLIETSSEASESSQLSWGFDLRVLGTLRRGKNTSSF